MKTFLALGEALIDFVPLDKHVPLHKVSTFNRVAGGAPANVAGCVAMWGIPSVLLTKLGNDAFGETLIDALIEKHVDTSHIIRTSDHETSLAFVSMKEDGVPDFQFYRNNAADLHLHYHEVDSKILDTVGVVHFCSVDLITSPMRETHHALLREAHKRGCIISFDPNLRFMLWPDKRALKETVLLFLKYATLMKVTEEELEFITGCASVSEGINFLTQNGVKLVLVTRGAKGASAYTATHDWHVSGISVKVVDTTGAGDSFIGTFLASILHAGIQNIETITDHDMDQFLNRANHYAAAMTCVEGGLASMMPGYFDEI